MPGNNLIHLPTAFCSSRASLCAKAAETREAAPTEWQANFPASGKLPQRCRRDRLRTKKCLLLSMLPVVKGGLSCRAKGQEKSREGWIWPKTALAETSLGKAKENMEEQQELAPWSRTPLPQRWDPPDPFLPSLCIFSSLIDLVFRVHFTAIGEKQELIRSL